MLEQTFDLQEVHAVSLELLSLLEEEGVPVPLGTVALAMTLGRAMSPRTLTQEEEEGYIKSVLEYSHLFFAPTGAPN